MASKLTPGKSARGDRQRRRGPAATAGPAGRATAHAPFPPGAMVLVTLANPREKYWGAIRELSPAGLSMRGLDLNCFDDFATQVRAGEPVSAGEVFFPMHRLERIELDAPSGAVASLAERFHTRTGRAAADVLGVTAGPTRSVLG